MWIACFKISMLIFGIFADSVIARDHNQQETQEQTNKQSQEKMSNQASGQFKSEILPCGSKPNCVSTEGPESHKISRLRLIGSFSEIKEIVKKQADQVLIEEENFLHVVYQSLVFRFPDDVMLKNVNGRILMRSSSRVGYSDMGVNRRRMQKLSSELQAKKLIEIE